jgi:hypothetical protein
MPQSMTNKRVPCGLPLKIPRVSYAALSAYFDFSDRGPAHCGRPSIEQTPSVTVSSLKKLGAADGVLVNLTALDSDLQIPLFVRATFAPDGGSMRFAWDYQPEIGESEVRTLDFRLAATHTGTGIWYLALCPHCDGKARVLFWGVSTFACRHCLTLRSESVRTGSFYSAEKAARLLRKKLGANEVPLSPLVIGRARRGRRALAERVWHAEMAMLSKLAGQ